MKNYLNLPTAEQQEAIIGSQKRIADALERQNYLLADQTRKQSDTLIKTWADVIQAVQKGIHTDVFSLRDYFIAYKASDLKITFTGYEESVVTVDDLQAFIRYVDCADPVSYEFIFDGKNWQRDGVVISSMSDIGISIEDAGFVSGDKITITVVANPLRFDVWGFNKEKCKPKYNIDVDYIGTTAENVAINSPDDFFEFVGSKAEKTYTFTRTNDEWVCNDDSVETSSDINGLEWYDGDFSNGDIIKITVTLAYAPNKSLTLHIHSLLPETVFDGEEALFKANNSLNAGTYHFYFGYNKKTIQFTATKSFQLFRAKYDGTTVYTYNNWNGDIIETLTATEGTGGTALDTTNGKFNHYYRSLWGNGRWDWSYLRQWAHSTEKKERVWNKQHDFDLPPHEYAQYTYDGFMRGLDPQFIRALSKVIKKTALHEIDGGGYVETEDLFFPLSATEWFSTPYYTPNSLKEGEPYDVCEKFSDHIAPNYSDDSNRRMYYNGCEYDHWQRSAYCDGCYNVQCVGGSGSADNCGSASGCCCVGLACAIVG